MVTVLFSNAQSRYTNGDTSVEVEAKRVDQLVRLLVERYAELEEILEHAAVSVDGVIHNDALYVPLPDRVEVQFVGAVAGGSGDAVSEALLNTSSNVLREAQAWLEAGRAGAVAPRNAGSQLIVDADGHFEGSVSGGCVEGAVIEKACEVLAQGEPAMLEFGVADEEAWSVGLACGGRVKIYVEQLL
jgi:molybdopterin converting factor small subunit